MSYTFRAIEAIAGHAQKDTERTGSSFISRENRISFDCITENPLPKKEADALLSFPSSDTLRQKYHNAVATPGFIDSGLLSFYDYGYFENCALPIDVFRRQALIGEPICWGSDYGEWYAKQHNLAVWFDREMSKSYLDNIIKAFNQVTLSDEIVILSAPGQEIYGHWLLDYAARLYNLGQSEFQTQPILLNNMPVWARYFLDTFDINPGRITKHPARLFKAAHAIVPTAAKSGHRLGATTLKAAWQHMLDRHVDTYIPSELKSDKIYFTRRHWNTGERRSVANRDEMEARFTARGYTLVAPETLSIPQQIELMRNARVIAGEDGSALHNIIFCPAGARLGVLSLPERNNLWHLGICQILGHRIAYCYLPFANDADMNLSEIDDFIDRLEA